MKDSRFAEFINTDLNKQTINAFGNENALNHFEFIPLVGGHWNGLHIMLDIFTFPTIPVGQDFVTNNNEYKGKSPISYSLKGRELQDIAREKLKTNPKSFWWKIGLMNQIESKYYFTPCWREYRFCLEHNNN